jgi:hypothetical protein
MTWKGKQPSVKVTENSYDTGVTVEKNIMTIYETALYRANLIYPFNHSFVLTLFYQKISIFSILFREVLLHL